MAVRPINTAANRWFATLDSGVTSGDTEFVLPSSGATGLPTRTLIHVNAEQVQVTAIATDTPSAGKDTLTVERGANGTTAAAHDAGEVLGHFFYADFHNETIERLQMLEQIFVQATAGGRDGVVQTAATALEVTAESTPSMTVEIATGEAVVDGHPVALLEATTLTFTAPSSDPRIDLVTIDQEGTVAAVTGTEDASPSAPAVPSGELKLAEITHTTAETVIKDADDSTNGYITDGRTWR